MKKVLVLGASGLIAPYVTPSLAHDYDLYLTDVKPHPSGTPTDHVDVTRYEQVLQASEGMDAIMNMTVIRHDIRSFAVNTTGAWHVMRAAAEHGIKKVVHTGPQLVRRDYDHDFDVDDVPLAPGTNFYGITKYLSMEICKIYAREHGIHTVCFLFNLLGAKPTEPASMRDFPPFSVVWEDLVHACRLALEIDSVPDHFQAFNLMSYISHGKYRADKAQRMLGYAPLERVEDYFKRRD